MNDAARLLIIGGLLVAIISFLNNNMVTACITLTIAAGGCVQLATKARGVHTLLVLGGINLYALGMYSLIWGLLPSIALIALATALWIYVLQQARAKNHQ